MIVYHMLKHRLELGFYYQSSHDEIYCREQYCFVLIVILEQYVKTVVLICSINTMRIVFMNILIKV